MSGKSYSENPLLQSTMAEERRLRIQRSMGASLPDSWREGEGERERMERERVREERRGEERTQTEEERGRDG